jgi:hypothetical protein
MRVGNFSVLIPQGRERSSGHVEMDHGQVYAIRLGNHDHRRCDAIVRVDGKEVGGFRLEPCQYLPLERPAHDTGCFTFFRAGSEEWAAVSGSKVEVSERGLIQVTFRPERCARVTFRPERCARVLKAGGARDARAAEEKTSGGIDLGGGGASFAKSGVTGLTGTSGQTFREVPNLDYEPGGDVVISIRLVCGAGVRELTPAPRGNAVPDPV